MSAPADGQPVVPVLVTERLILRAFRSDDLDAYAAMVADPAAVRFLGTGEVLNRAGAWLQMALFAGHWALRGYGLWAAQDKRSGALVGRVGLWNPEGWPGLEVGWMLAPAFWGRGYATEGARAALDFAFARLAVDDVISVIDADNAASIRVAERLGEAFVRSLTLQGRKVAVYGISRDQYRAAARARA